MVLGRREDISEEELYRQGKLRETRHARPCGPLQECVEHTIRHPFQRSFRIRCERSIQTNIVRNDVHTDLDCVSNRKGASSIQEIASADTKSPSASSLTGASISALVARDLC